MLWRLLYPLAKVKPVRRYVSDSWSKARIRHDVNRAFTKNDELIDVKELFDTLD